MRKSTNYEMNLFDEDEFYSEELFNENTEKIDEVMKSLDTPEYDTSLQKDVENLSSGESLKVALRKLAKAVADYISHKADQVVHITAEERNAWNAKLGVEKIANNLTTNTYGKVLDAYQGKTLLEKINNLTTTQDGTVQTNINWNTIKVPGLFRYLIHANDPGMNAPELNIPFYLVVIKKDDNNLEQWAYSAVSNVRYTRVYASGEWGAWAKVLTNEDIATNLATDRSDMLLAASMGKNLQDQISTLNSNKTEIKVTYIDTTTDEYGVCDFSTDKRVISAYLPGFIAIPYVDADGQKWKFKVLSVVTMQAAANLSTKLWLRYYD